MSFPVSLIDGLTPLQRQLIDLCRSLQGDEQHRVTAKGLLQTLATTHFNIDPETFEIACDDLNVEVLPIESYPPDSLGYAYRTLLQMGQPWRCRYPYFDLSGMYGDIHDDMPSGPEYVEVRLSHFTQVLFPAGKPPRLPTSLINGVSVDGVQIPSHNIEELWTAYEYVRQDPKIALSDLMEVLPGPDFMSYGVVAGTDEIVSLYEKGEGRLCLRADIQEEIEGGRTRIAITSLPPGVLIKKVIDQIRALTREGLLSFYDFKDNSHRYQVRIVIDAHRKFSASMIKEVLFQKTDLERQVTFRCAPVGSDNLTGRPSLIGVLRHATSVCSPTWERKDKEPTDYVPLLKEVMSHGGYTSPLSDLSDRRRTRLLKCL